MQNKEPIRRPPALSDRFVRKTHLDAGEYRKNFHQIDRDIIAAVTSKAADLVTPLMSKIYLQMVNAPTVYWERDGVLRFEGQATGEGKHLNAWMSLCALLGVASATARKALCWMHDVGVIGYFAGKNGVGIRIFMNRAASSIGNRQTSGGKNILSFPRTSSAEAHASHSEVPFNDSFAVLDTPDSNNYSDAPKTGAEEQSLETKSSNSTPGITPGQSKFWEQPGGHLRNTRTVHRTISVEDLVRRLKCELEFSLEQTARQAASREHERTREWLEKSGLPKAARVAQREAYNVLRKLGVINQDAGDSHVAANVGRTEYIPEVEHVLSCEEIEELAGACVAMLEIKGQSIDVTLNDMSTEAGGFLRPEDAHVVRETVHSLLRKDIDRERHPCSPENTHVSEHNLAVPQSYDLP